MRKANTHTRADLGSCADAVEPRQAPEAGLAQAPGEEQRASRDLARVYNFEQDGAPAGSAVGNTDSAHGEGNEVPVRTVWEVSRVGCQDLVSPPTAIGGYSQVAVDQATHGHVDRGATFR